MKKAGILTRDSPKNIMEKNMETTIMGYIRVILGLYRNNGKENGNCCSVIGFRV